MYIHIDGPIKCIVLYKYEEGRVNSGDTEMTLRMKKGGQADIMQKGSTVKGNALWKDAEVRETQLKK